MKHIDKPIIDAPVEGFGETDVFFSRTDLRGVIQSANAVFVRLSRYDWSSLSGAPHRIIRHPDMPKSVFHLMWTMIKQGKVFGGYVKNRAACGKYYWVFSVVVPVQGGYLSVRIKPGTETFSAAQQLYKSLKSHETKTGFDPMEAEKQVSSELESLGYKSYEYFMVDAIDREIRARPDLMGPKAAGTMEKLSTMAGDLSILQNMVNELEDMFETIRTVPLNLKIAGTRHNDAGRGVQAVASNYNNISTELMQADTQISEQLQDLNDQASLGRMSFCSSIILRDAIAKFACEEPVLEASAYKEELQLVQQAYRDFMQQAIENCQLVKDEVNRFSRLNSRIRKHLSALSVTRVTCRIEAASLSSDAEGIHSIANQLTTFQETISSLLGDIATTCTRIENATPDLCADELGSF